MADKSADIESNIAQARELLAKLGFAVLESGEASAKALSAAMMAQHAEAVKCLKDAMACHADALEAHAKAADLHDYLRDRMVEGQADGAHQKDRRQKAEAAER